MRIKHFYSKKYLYLELKIALMNCKNEGKLFIYHTALDKLVVYIIVCNVYYIKNYY